MSYKKRSGFVLLLFALVLFSSVFVSATDYFGPLHTQVITCSKTTTNSFRCDLPNSMEVVNFTVSANLPSASSLSSCKFNLSVNSSGATPVYLDPVGTSQVSIVTSKAPTVQSLNFIFSPTTGLKRAPIEVKTIFIDSTSGCSPVSSKINIYSISVVGKYSLPITNRTLVNSTNSILAANAPIVIPLNNPSEMEVTQVDVNFSIISSSPVACPVFVYLRSGTQDILINGAGETLGSLTVGSLLPLSYPVTLASKNSHVVISTSKYYPSSGANKALCYKNILNVTGVSVKGRVTAVCNSNFQRVDSECNSTGQFTRTITDLNGCVPINTVVMDCEESLTCSSKCGNITSALAAPSFTSFPLVCNYSGDCERNIRFGSADTNVVYDLVWRYNYFDGNITEICACNGTSDFKGHKVRVAPNTPVSLRVSDDNTKMISSVELLVYAFNGSARSVYTNSTLTNIYYGCSSGCSVLNNKSEIVDSDPTNYDSCERIGNSYCFNWTERTCSIDTNAMLFDSVSNSCKNNGSYGCGDESAGPKTSFCNFSTVSLSMATPKNPVLGVCGLNGFNVGCYQCNASYKYDSAKGYCTKCTGNQQVVGCEQNGGICNNSNTFNGLAKNESFDCCNPDFNCFKCPAGQHFYDNTCVSNNCTGIDRPLFNDSKAVFGVNITTNSSFSMVWNFVNSSNVNACQWSCAAGYKLNESDNVSCVEREKFNCTLEGGVCSITNVENSTESSAGNCTSTAAKCFMCQNNFKSNGTACVPKTCVDDGKVNNGIGCVAPLTTCENGCPYDKNGRSICLPNKARVNAPNGNKYYCNSTSHTFRLTLSNGASCTWDTQCTDNFCFVNETTQVSVCQSLDSLGGIRSLVVDFVCWFKHMGNSESRQQCRLAEASSYLRSN